MPRTATIPTDLLNRMAPAAQERAVANQTLLEATAWAAKYIELHGRGSVNGMAEESYYSADVCQEALTRLVDAGQASAAKGPAGVHTWYSPSEVF